MGCTNLEDVERMEQDESSKPGIVVVMNGFPGSGKFTMLQKVHESYADGTSRFVDNHQLIDPATSVYPDRAPEHHAMRRRIREVVFAELRRVAQQGATVLLTACLAANKTDAEVMSEHLSIVRHSHVPMLWINIHCDPGTLKERVQSLERRQGTKTKLTDWGVFSKMIEDNKLIDPSD